MTNTPTNNSQGAETLKRGDIVLNGYAGEENRLHIVTGSTSRKTGPYTVTKYYKTRCLFRGKLVTRESLFSQNDNKLDKIGHFDIDEPVVLAMQKALEAAL